MMRELSVVYEPWNHTFYGKVVFIIIRWWGDSVLLGGIFVYSFLENVTVKDFFLLFTAATS